QQAARLRIEGVYQAPRARRVEDAILNQWSRFESAQSRQIVRPGEAELAYRLLIDCFGAAKALLGIGTAIGDPIRGVRVSCAKARVIHDGYASVGATRDCQKD